MRISMLKRDGRLFLRCLVPAVVLTVVFAMVCAAAALAAVRGAEDGYTPVKTAVVDGEDSVYVIDQLCDRESSEESWVEDISLREAMKRLGERERAIIEMRFFRGRTQMEIAADIGISQAQVSRLEKSALERLRKHM